MGEIADFYLDHAFAEHDPFCWGDCDSGGRPSPQCYRCGADCEWKETPEGWRLFSDGKPHVCRDRLPDPSDFGPVT